MKTKIAGPLLPCGHNTIFEGPIEPDTDDDAPWKCKYCEKFRIEIFDLPMVSRLFCGKSDAFGADYF